MNSRLRVKALVTYSNQGARPAQEDYIVADPKRKIFVVADGFGGPVAGLQASKSACEAVKGFLEREAGDPEATLPFILRKYFSLAGNVLFNALIHANRHLGNLNIGKSANEKGGASVLAGFIDGDLLAIASVGVCSAWIYRGGQRTRLNTPRSYGWLDDPFSSGNELPLMALGMFSDLEPEISEMRVRSGDWIVLHTDGITPETLGAIEEVNKMNSDAGSSAERLQSMLAATQYEDNASISIMII